MSILTLIALASTGLPVPGSPGETARAEPVAEPVRIAWNWPPDPGLRYEFTNSAKDITPTAAQRFIFTRDMTRVVRHEAMESPSPDAADGTAPQPVRIVWESLGFAEDSNVGARREFDTTLEHHRDRTTDPGIARFAAIAGESAVFHMRPDGSFARIDGLGEMVRGMESKLSRWGHWNDRVHDELAATYTTHAMRAMSEPLYRFLPATPVRVGDAHEVRRLLTLPKVMMMRTIETHTLDGIITDEEGRRVAIYRVSGEVEWPELPPGLNEVFTVAVNSGEITGAWRFDVDAGRLIESEITVSFNADVIRYDPATRASTEIPTRQIITDRARLLPRNPASD
jgi:hypothetical protein